MFRLRIIALVLLSGHLIYDFIALDIPVYLKYVVLKFDVMMVTCTFLYFFMVIFCRPLSKKFGNFLLTLQLALVIATSLSFGAFWILKVPLSKGAYLKMYMQKVDDNLPFVCKKKSRK